jgi:hypothetical protein
MNQVGSLQQLHACTSKDSDDRMHQAILAQHAKHASSLIVQCSTVQCP